MDYLPEALSSPDSPANRDEGSNLKIEVFHMPPTRSHRVLWAINKIGLEDCTTAHAIRLYAGEHKRDEVKELNPLMQIPVMILTDGEGRKRTMTERCAIPSALSELCDDRLSPPKKNVLSRATYHRVNAMCAANLGNALVGTPIFQIYLNAV